MTEEESKQLKPGDPVFWKEDVGDTGKVLEVNEKGCHIHWYSGGISRFLHSHIEDVHLSLTPPVPVDMAALRAENEALKKQVERLKADVEVWNRAYYHGAIERRL